MFEFTSFSLYEGDNLVSECTVSPWWQVLELPFTSAISNSLLGELGRWFRIRDLDETRLHERRLNLS
jgi:hypothetical protein